MKVYVVVGGGQAGASAAMELRRAGFDGRVVVVGEEPHMPYERPSLSKSQLVDTAAALPMLQAPDLYARERIEVRTGVRALRIDAQAHRLILSDGSSQPYDELLIATGGRARALAVPGGEHALLLRHYQDAKNLRDRLRGTGHLTVVGAGVIGMEVAASARQLGWEVTVLEVGARAMARMVPPTVSKALEARHREAGVVFQFGCGLSRIDARDDGRFDLDTGDGTLTTDLVLAGIGLVPNVELAAEAGAAVRDGILVDAQGRTSLPQVHAAGDVACFPDARSGRHLRLESWQHAARHACAVARNMLGERTVYQDVPWAWSDQYELNLQVLGQPLDGTEEVVRGDLAERKFVTLHLRDGRVVGATLLNMGREMRPCKSLIESGLLLDAARLADPAIALRVLAAPAPAAAAVS